MAKSRDEIFQDVQEVLVDALGVDDDEVKAEATLMGDLGAEGIWNKNSARRIVPG